MDSFWDLPEEQISAVHALEGRTLNTGWLVKERVKAKPQSTGGHFSVCYLAEKDGEIGFLKALNILTFVRDDQNDLPRAMANMLNTYNYEKEILVRCNNQKLSKVSRLLDAGEENIAGFIFANVYYMILEKGDGDVRNHLRFTESVDIAWKLRSLHNIATGLKQLHGIRISHQDLKPSNVFVFDKVTSKVGDLGRSLCQNLQGPHSNLDFSGDKGYAPPEFFHGFVLPDWNDKAFAIDCFLLGSMTTYYFTGQSMTSLLSQKIDSRINILSLNFENALPYWIAAFEEALDVLDQHLQGHEDREELTRLVRMLSFPDPRLRGHIKNIHETGSNYQLTRFVEAFNLLARRAEFRVLNAN
jgi:eukaryotic-like serine/threonine-protein kinase